MKFKYLNQYKKLKSEWSVLKNGCEMPPKTELLVSHKYWWVCKLNTEHVWLGLLMHRLRGSGCPYCAGKLVNHSNSLKTLFPKLANSWHPCLNGVINPEKVTYKNKKRVWWVCDKDKKHVWQASIGSRANGSGCPYCVNQKINYQNCLFTTHPEIAAEWHPSKNKITSLEVSKGSNKKSGGNVLKNMNICRPYMIVLVAMVAHIAPTIKLQRKLLYLSSHLQLQKNGI